MSLLIAYEKFFEDSLLLQLKQSERTTSSNIIKQSKLDVSPFTIFNLPENMGIN